MTSGHEATPLFLGIEGGGTRTVALVADADNKPRYRIETDPANLSLIDDRRLTQILRSVARRLPGPAAIGIGLAGARTETDRDRIRRAAARVWPGLPCRATNDLETALLADEEAPSGLARRASGAKSDVTRVLVLSGTGSCCFGRSRNGRTVKVGGWGHLLGDKGSGYEIGLRALKAVIYQYDRDGVWPRLGRQLLRKLQLNDPDDLIGWAYKASKSDIAAISVEVFEAWRHGDKTAADILDGAADSLSRDAVDCARRLAKPRSRVRFLFAGGVLLRQPRFAHKVSRLLQKLWPGAVVARPERESVWGAVMLARKQFEIERTTSSVRAKVIPVSRPRISSGHALPSLDSLALSPTEKRNPRSRHLDRLSLDLAIRLVLSEDASIPRAVLAERRKIAQAIGWIVQSFKRGGRLFYVGAGTSGRLGVLDASECPPTFRTRPDLVQGIIAGGQRALWESIEGAEDEDDAGARAIQFRGVSSADVVIGIAASGRTPFVWGALWEAKKRKARTVLMCFNPRLKVSSADKPDLVLAPDVGPEILTGSTRLKAGTATKLILNLFTTLSMVRMGKVIGNLMIDVNPSNVKLRDRAVRIVCELTRVNRADATTALEKSGWIVKDALRALRGGTARAASRRTPQRGSTVRRLQLF